MPYHFYSPRLHLNGLVFVLAFLCINSTARSMNLLEKGGFESAGEISVSDSGWKNFVAQGNATFRKDNVRPRSGSSCAVVETKEDATALLISDPPQPVVPG